MSETPTQYGGTVLVIEDSNVQAKIIAKQIFALSNYETIVANTMEEAQTVLQQAEAYNIFAAVVDLNLPDAPYGEAVDLALEYNVPSIVLTATFNDELRESFIDKRVVDYFFKGSIQEMDPMVHAIERLDRNRFIKVLIVDDMRVERTIIRKMLQVQNFQVLEAAHGREGLEILEQNPDIQMIITDYNMPEMDGFELIKAVRENHRPDKLAIIGVSAAGSGSLTAKFLKNGANDFLTKPFENEEFYCRCNRTMDFLEMVDELKNCYDLSG